MNVVWTGLILAVVLSLVGVVADSLLKLASAETRPFWNRWFFLGLLVSAGFAMLWVLLMQNMKLATAGILCAMTSMLLLVGVGVIGFGERLNGSESAGVALALVAVALLGRAAA